MNKYFYELPQDSELGRKISDFWTKCMRCEREAERYAKAMGAATYYEDPAYFAGGCLCIAFRDDVKVDQSVWREAGRVKPDDDGGGETVYWEPDVERRKGRVEVPSREYALKDTFNRIYQRDGIVLDGGRLYVPYVEFYRDESKKGSDGMPRTASHGLRRAIKAEVRRRRLPVMRAQDLLDILGAQVPDKAAEIVTPTFFPYRSRYFVGCAYPCTAPGMTEITQMQYQLNQNKHVLDAKRQN